MPLLIKAALDVVTHVLQYGDIHLTHLLPPVCTGLDVALLHQQASMKSVQQTSWHVAATFQSLHGKPSHQLPQQ